MTNKVFQGSDYVVIFDGKIADVVSCRTNNFLSTIELDCELSISIVEQEPIFKNATNSRVLEVFMKEQHEKMVKKYTGVKYLGQKAKSSVDDERMLVTFVFAYKDEYPFSKLEHTASIYSITSFEKDIAKRGA